MIEIKKLIIVALSLSLFSCGGGSSGSGAGVDAPMEITGPILAIGDSITNGKGVATPWPSLLSDRIGQNVINHSSNGKLTSWGVSQLPSLLAQHEPQVVLILLGTNDSRTPSGGTGAVGNLQAMVSMVRNNGGVPYVATLPPITGSSELDNNAARISQEIRRISDAVIVDVRSAMGSGQGLIADGIHPNAAGQNVIAGEFASALN